LLAGAYAVRGRIGARLEIRDGLIGHSISSSGVSQ
jgi:hypothetical protein